MRLPRTTLSLAFLFALPAFAAEIVLTDPTFGEIKASALDQPRLYALISDPLQGGGFITWQNPDDGAIEPVLLPVFVDTGASGFAISHLNATGDLDQPDLGLDAADYIGPFTETGVGGEEAGDVSRPLGVWVRSGPPSESGEMLPSEFVPFGDFNLWVRRETGAGEYNDFLGADPINLVGMPAIRQRRLLLDPTPMEAMDPMETALLAPGAPEPATQATVSLVLRDFVGATPPPGEALPSHAANPLVPGLTLTQGTLSASGEWLLDTGAGSSFASFATAKAVGLIPAQYATLAAFMADYHGPTADIGGIGASQIVPILKVDRISVPTREGATLVWKNVDLLIADVAGLDGIFGMNLLVPAVTIDSSTLAGLGLGSGDETGGNLVDLLGPLLALLFDISPGAFTSVVIDTTNAADPVMRLATPLAGGTVFSWLGQQFTGGERLQPAVGTLTADPDGDGAANLMEYALGLDPHTANANATPIAGEIAMEGGKFLTLSFSRPAGGSPGVNYIVEVSNDLQTWRRGSSDVVLQETVAAGGREVLTYRSTAPLNTGTHLFLRLTVEVAP